MPSRLNLLIKAKWANSFTVAFLLTFFSLYVYTLNLDFFQLLELKSYDIKVRAKGVRPITDRVVIVAVDEKSLRFEGRWPWPRTLMARLVDKISQSEASAIGFDILFPEKDVYVPFAEVEKSLKKVDVSRLDQDSLIAWLKEVGASDRKFALALERSNRSVLGYFVYSSEDLAGSSSEKLNASHLELLDFSQISIVQRFDTDDREVPLRPVYSVGMSLPELMNGANSAGFVSFVPETDGVVRWVPMVMNHEEYFFPPLSLQILHEALRLPTGVTIAPFGVYELRLGDRHIPTAENGDFLINYYGPAYTFTHYSATDVLSGKIGARELKEKIVLIGGTATGTHDIHTSPFGPLYPGVEVHANVIENLLQEDYLVRPEWLRMLDIFMILFSGLLLGWLSRIFKANAMALFLAGGVISYLLVDFYLFSVQGLWVHTVFPVMTQLFVYSGITLYKFAFEEREKRFIKGAFSQFLAPVVVDRLVANPALLKLGGEKKVLTAFFSDVAGFSTISENLTPEGLVDLLNQYLTEMTDIIMKYEGTVDKFEGDAIIAFFGAPLPFDDHARRTCFAALEMQQRLEELRAQWKKQGKHELFVRIGINTGPMVVGNMGSRSRMDYTIMGDSVNLAARLEGVNKVYKTYLMISEFTLDQAREDVEVRELDVIRVMGKSEPVKIYELLAKKGELSEKAKEITKLYNQGLTHYKNRQWRESLDYFEKVLRLDKQDGPSLTYIDRCTEFLMNPPADDWDGVFSMTSK